MCTGYSTFQHTPSIPLVSCDKRARLLLEFTVTLSAKRIEVRSSIPKGCLSLQRENLREAKMTSKTIPKTDIPSPLKEIPIVTIDVLVIDISFGMWIEGPFPVKFQMDNPKNFKLSISAETTCRGALARRGPCQPCRGCRLQSLCRLSTVWKVMNMWDVQ